MPFRHWHHWHQYRARAGGRPATLGSLPQFSVEEPVWLGAIHRPVAVLHCGVLPTTRGGHRPFLCGTTLW